jgi:hypothetical protein
LFLLVAVAAPNEVKVGADVLVPPNKRVVPLSASGNNLPVLIGKGRIAVIAKIKDREHNFVISDVLYVDKL